MRLETVAESWGTYRKGVVPADAPPIQVEECRRAFYAGVYFLLLNCLYNIGDESTSEEEGEAELAKLKRECELFARDVGMPLPSPILPPPEAPRGPQPATVAESHYTTAGAAEMRPLLQMLARRVASGLPKGWGFNLMLFAYGTGGDLFYISSAQRADVLDIMREYIRRNTR